MRNFKYYIPGITLIVSAVFALAAPKVVAFLFAAFFMFTGFWALYIGKLFRTAEVEIKEDINFRHRTMRSDLFDRIEVRFRH